MLNLIASATITLIYAHATTTGVMYLRTTPSHSYPTYVSS